MLMELSEGILLRYFGREESVVIPDTVRAIGDGAFFGCAQMRSVTIPPCVTTIGRNAFRGCERLESIRIPGTVERVGDLAFAGCHALEAAEFENTAAVRGLPAFSFLKGRGDIAVVGQGLFRGCGRLKKLTVGGREYPLTDGEPAFVFEQAANDAAGRTGVFRIENGVLTGFTEAPGQTVVCVPPGVTGIGDRAFSRADRVNRFKKRLRKIILPTGVREIGPQAFSGCVSLVSVVIPDSVTKIGPYAFYDCRSLQRIALPPGIRQIPPGMCLNDRSLQSVVIPDGVTGIGKDAFCDCRRLKTVTLPAGPCRIGENAFGGCPAEEAPEPIEKPTVKQSAFTPYIRDGGIVLPASVTRIDPEEFAVFHLLDRIKVDPDNPVFDSREGCNAVIRRDTGELVVGCRSTVIPGSVTAIGDHALAGVGSIGRLVIPESVTRIGDGAFRSCIDLESVVIGPNVRRIGRDAFARCGRLKEAVFPEGVERIGHCCFEGCGSLREIALPDSLAVMGNRVFAGCGDLSRVRIGKGLKRPGILTFSGCFGLRAAEIDAGNPWCYTVEKPSGTEIVSRFHGE